MAVLRLCVNGVVSDSLQQGEMNDATFKKLALKLENGCKMNFKECKTDYDARGCPTHLHFKSEYNLASAVSLWGYLTHGH